MLDGRSAKVVALEKVDPFSDALWIVLKVDLVDLTSWWCAI